MKPKLLICVGLFLSAVLLPTYVHAATQSTQQEPILRSNDLKTCLFGSDNYDLNKNSGLENQPPGSCSAEDLFLLANNLIQWMVGVSGALALFMFIWGGTWMIFSGGNSSRVDRGKDILIGTTIALIFLLGSWVIVQFIVRDALKANFTLQDIKPLPQPKPSNKTGCCLIPLSANPNLNLCIENQTQTQCSTDAAKIVNASQDAIIQVDTSCQDLPDCSTPAGYIGFAPQ